MASAFLLLFGSLCLGASSVQTFPIYICNLKGRALRRKLGISYTTPLTSSVCELPLISLWVCTTSRGGDCNLHDIVSLFCCFCCLFLFLLSCSCSFFLFFSFVPGIIDSWLSVSGQPRVLFKGRRSQEHQTQKDTKTFLCANETKLAIWITAINLFVIETYFCSKLLWSIMIFVVSCCDP